MSLNLRVLTNLLTDQTAVLPLAILYITDRCNSRCITCDYWRYGQTNMAPALAEQIARELPALGTRMALVSGGEPLLHPRWYELVASLRGSVPEIVLLTSGILLPKHVERVRALCAHTIVSLDGANPGTYKRIRGVDGFAPVERGVRALVAAGGRVSLRCTVQRENYRELPALIRLARAWGVQQISFLAVDVSTHAAFARQADFDQTMALAHDDLDAFDRVLDAVEREFAREFADGFIAESPEKLRRLRQYFGGLLGEQALPPVRCNAPQWSCVIRTDGTVQPCYFIEQTADGGRGTGDGGRVTLRERLNEPGMIALRAAIRRGQRAECQRCVCSAYRGPFRLVRGD